MAHHSNVHEAQPGVLRALVDHLSAMVAYWDADQRCRFANRAYERWFGVDPRTMVGRDMREFLGPLYELNFPYIQGVLRGEPQEFEREIPDPAGGTPRHSLAQYLPDIVDGQVQGFYVLVTDITRLKAAEKAQKDAEHRFEASERLAGLATLAAGIAHEINNPLAAALAHVEVALEGLQEAAPDPTAFREDLVVVRDNALRVHDIVQSMKLLARGDATRRETVNVNDTLARCIDVVASSLRYRATVIRDLEPGLHVEGNVSQLAQVFVNLLSNAAQSLPEASSPLTDTNAHAGVVRVSTRLESDKVVIEVADNGCGIPESLQARIFEPFFTTKPVGTGMGLGLSVSNTIVNGFGGRLSVTSHVGSGSVFRVELPAAATLRSVARPATWVGGPPPAGRQAAARPRVLVIDDEAAITKILQRILGRDCDVVATTDGHEAISLLLNPDVPAFDVVLCDLMMPEPSGETIYTTVTMKRPDLGPSFVFMTGGAFTPRSRRFLETVPAPVVGKPFELELLRRLMLTVRGVARP